MSRPIKAIINLSSLRHNYLTAKKIVAPQFPNVKAWAVIKANAYGHGLMPVAKALKDIADGYALIEVDWAVSLREAGFTQPIILLEGFFDRVDAKLCCMHQITCAFHNLEQIKIYGELQKTQKNHLPVYIKFNSGMNRLGFTIKDCNDLIAAINKYLPNNPITLMTHFATADDEQGVNWQMTEFNRIVEIFAKNFSIEKSTANSATILRYPQYGYNWIRPGIMLYGSSPFAEQNANSLNLKPVMTLRSEILQVQNIQAGEKVGYGCSFIADKPTRVGVVACGYADGYLRSAPSGTPILVDGIKTIIIGRVSMDMITCDLTDISKAKRGSKVTLWGEGLSADEVATSAGSISYELFCGISKRVVKEYLSS